MDVGQFGPNVLCQHAISGQEVSHGVGSINLPANHQFNMRQQCMVAPDGIYGPAHGSANTCVEIAPPETEIDDNQMHVVRAFKAAAGASSSLLLLPDTNIFLLKTYAGVRLLRSLLEKASCFIQWPGLPNPVQVQNVMQIQVPYMTLFELNTKKDGLRKAVSINVATELDGAGVANPELTQRLISQACELINEYHRMLQLQSVEDHTNAYESFVAHYGAEYCTNDGKILASAVYLRDSNGGRLPVIISNDKTFGLMAKAHHILAADVANLYQLNEFITKAVVTPDLSSPSSPMSVPGNFEAANSPHDGSDPMIDSLAHTIMSAARGHVNGYVANGSVPADDSSRDSASGKFYDRNQLHRAPMQPARPPPPPQRMQTSNVNGAHQYSHAQRPSGNSSHSAYAEHRNLSTNNVGSFRGAPNGALSSYAVHAEDLYPLDNTPQNLLFYKRVLTGYLQDLINDVIRLEIYTRALEQSHLPTDVIVEESKLTSDATTWLTYTYSDNERKGSLPNVLDALVSLQKHNRALLDNYSRELKLERLLSSVVSITRVIERGYDGSSRTFAVNDLPKCKTFKDVHRWGSEVFPLIRALTHRQPPWSPSFTKFMRRTPHAVLNHYRSTLSRIEELCNQHGLGNVATTAAGGGGTHNNGATRLKFGGNNYGGNRSQQPVGICAAMDAE